MGITWLCEKERASLNFDHTRETIPNLELVSHSIPGEDTSDDDTSQGGSFDEETQESLTAESPLLCKTIEAKNCIS